MAKKKTGRPTKYSDELADKICSLISNTSQGLSAICEADDMPSTVTVYSWLGDDKHKYFLNEYARARESQADLLADEIISIADDSSGDRTTTDDGREVMDSEFVGRSRLRVDARKWKASKLAPKKYGEKLQTEVSGGLTITVTPPKNDE